MKKKQRNDVVIAYTTLDLSLVLQRSTQDEEITFKAGTGEREEKKEGRVFHLNDKDKDKDKEKEKEKANAEQAAAAAAPFAVWSYPEEIETVEDANDYELVPEISDEEEYVGESGGESMDDDEPVPVVPNGTAHGTTAPNTPSKTLLAQRLLQHGAPMEYSASQPAKGKSGNASANASTSTSTSSKQQNNNKSSRLRHLWQSSKPILTRAVSYPKSKDTSDSENEAVGSDPEMDQYFESSSNSDPSDYEDRLSPNMEFTPPGSPKPTRTPTHERTNSSNSTPASPTHVPALPQWGSAKDLLSLPKENSILHSIPAANTSFTLNSSAIQNKDSSFSSLPSINSSSNIPSNAANAAAIAAAIDAMRPTSPPVPSTISKLTSSTDLASAAGIILINGAKWRGRKLEECLMSALSPFPGRYRVVCTKRSADVQSVITNIFSRQQLMRVAVAGGDSYINEVLRPFVEQLGKKPRGWDSLHFYVIPIGKNNNDLAGQLAMHDSTYKSLFFSHGWQHVFSSREQSADDEVREIQQRVLQYLDEESTVPVRFPIGEALITYPDSAGKSVPFLKGVHIADPAEEKEDEHDSNLQLDYWVPKKKAGGSEDHHLEYKGAFQFAAVTRLPCVATALRLAAPTASVLSLLVQPRDRKGRKNMLTSFATKLGKKGKDEKEKGKPGEKDKDTKKKKDEASLTALVTKLVCSVSNDSANGVFRAVVDGVEYPGVKFVSLSPQWASHVKTFTVQAFACEGEPQGTPTPPSSISPPNVPTISQLGTIGVSTTALPTNSAPSASGSTTPSTGARSSPVMASQPFPPLNLNAVKPTPGSPLTTLKHSTGQLPSGMNSATDMN